MHEAVSCLWAFALLFPHLGYLLFFCSCITPSSSTIWSPRLGQVLWDSLLPPHPPPLCFTLIHRIVISQKLVGLSY